MGIAAGATTNRDAIKQRSPTWLQGDVGEKYLYSVALMLDALAEGARQGMIAHIPVTQAMAAQLGTTTPPPDALPVIGDDDQIAQGFAESADAYSLRLQQAYDTWAGAGGAWRTLSNLLGYVSPVAPVVRVVTTNGIWDSMNDPNAPQTGVPTWRVYSPQLPGNAGLSNWNWDGQGWGALVQRWWWRAFTILYSIQGPWSPAPVIGSGPPIGQTTGSIGFTASPDQVQTMRKIAGTFKGGNIWIQWMIVSFDASLFAPLANLPSVYLPDGTWGRWAKVGTVAGLPSYVPSRNTSACYCDGVT